MSPAEEPTLFVGAHVPESVVVQVREIAERDDRPVAWVIRQALRNHVANFGVSDDEREKAA